MDNTVKPVQQLKADPSDFLQVTRGYMKEQRALVRRSPSAWEVFSLFTERMNKTNAIVASQNTIAEILGLSRQTVATSIKILQEGRWIQVVKIGNANAYVVNSKVVWRDHAGKRYAHFCADIIASESEQIEDWEGVELKSVPVLKKGEKPVSADEELPPPDQRDLLPLDEREFLTDKATGEITRRDPHTVDFIAGQADQEAV